MSESFCPMCGERHNIGNPCITNTLRPGAPITKPRDPLLTERQKTHGDFKSNADISQAIKKIMHDPFGETRHPYVLSMVHREALDMIALKLSRILSGQADFKDHWDDISGYAKLASEACDK